MLHPAFQLCLAQAAGVVGVERIELALEGGVGLGFGAADEAVVVAVQRGEVDMVVVPDRIGLLRGHRHRRAVLIEGDLAGFLGERGQVGGAQQCSGKQQAQRYHRMTPWGVVRR
ncbi:hypothetical protein ACSBPQ_02510 [Stenotrophomonas sp. JC08]|uniref:hypothetical protein n=1 Tax=Stenotrophomonas sp. JC08 TaxID=3445779 RepID=UPI003FA2C300